MIALYLDCSSGISGDMLLAALVDLGVPEDVISGAIEALHLEGWHIEWRETHKGALRARQASVRVTDDATSRSYADIRALLEGSELDDRTKTAALGAFRALAEAEAKVHGTDVDTVHFHEVGGLDAIVDIVGVSAALVHVSAPRIFVSPIATGRGGIATEHGELPLPAPAVLELLHGAVLEERGTQELVTPTGAALLAANAHIFGAMPRMRVMRVGHGAGVRDLPWPNVLRVVLGELVEVEDTSHEVVIEANVDDMNPELIPSVLQRALDAGARDAWTTPIVMKKGRPAVTLSLLVDASQQDRFLDLLFTETTTFGARSYPVSKHELERRSVQVEVEGHPVRVKLALRGSQVLTMSVEHDDALAVSSKTSLPLKEVYDRARSAALSGDGPAN